MYTSFITRKTNLKIQLRQFSDEVSDTSQVNTNDEDQCAITDYSYEYVEGETIALTKEETEFAKLLDLLAPGILPLNKSVLLRPVPDDVFEKLFAKNVKFSDKVNLLKPYLGQPHRPSLVEKMPTSSADVVKHSPDKKEAIELLYILRCIAAIFPETSDDLLILAKEAFSGDERNFDRAKIVKVLEYLKKLRGASAPVSSVVSAALKLFYTVDGMAFDDFSVTLTALEWEIITKNMNEIRIKFAKEIREKSTELYHLTKSKETKLADKKELDDKINKERHPLVKIMKLTLEDFHYKVQLSITKQLDFKDSLKKVKYDRKDMIATIKSSILEYYRKNPNVDILKYAKETIIGI